MSLHSVYFQVCFCSLLIKWLFLLYPSAICLVPRNQTTRDLPALILALFMTQNEESQILYITQGQFRLST